MANRYDSSRELHGTVEQRIVVERVGGQTVRLVVTSRPRPILPLGVAIGTALVVGLFFGLATSGGGGFGFAMPLIELAVIALGGGVFLGLAALAAVVVYARPRSGSIVYRGAERRLVRERGMDVLGWDSVSIPEGLLVVDAFGYRVPRRGSVYVPPTDFELEVHRSTGSGARVIYRLIAVPPGDVSLPPDRMGFASSDLYESLTSISSRVRSEVFIFPHGTLNHRGIVDRVPMPTDGVLLAHDVTYQLVVFLAEIIARESESPLLTMAHREHTLRYPAEIDTPLARFAGTVLNLDQRDVGEAPASLEVVRDGDVYTVTPRRGVGGCLVAVLVGMGVAFAGFAAFIAPPLAIFVALFFGTILVLAAGSRTVLTLRPESLSRTLHLVGVKVSQRTIPWRSLEQVLTSGHTVVLVGDATFDVMVYPTGDPDDVACWVRSLLVWYASARAR